MWIITAIIAAMLWGLSYAVSERLMKQGLSATTLMFFYVLFAVPIYGMLSLKFSKIDRELALLKQSSTYMLTIGFIVVCYLAANLLTFWAIQQKNATSVSLVEIAYPLFTAFFAWAIFKDMQINVGITCGALLIASGVACVSYFSR